MVTSTFSAPVTVAYKFKSGHIHTITGVTQIDEREDRHDLETDNGLHVVFTVIEKRGEPVDWVVSKHLRLTPSPTTEETQGEAAS